MLYPISYIQIAGRCGFAVAEMSIANCINSIEAEREQDRQAGILASKYREYDVL